MPLKTTHWPNPAERQPQIQLDHSALESCGGQAERHRKVWGWLNPVCVSYQAASLSFNLAQLQGEKLPSGAWYWQGSLKIQEEPSGIKSRCDFPTDFSSCCTECWTGPALVPVHSNTRFQWVSGSSELPQGSYCGAAWGTAHKPEAQVQGALEKPTQPILGEFWHQVKPQKLGGGNQKPSNVQCHKPKHFTSNMLANFNLLHWTAGWIYGSYFYNLPLKKLFDLFHWAFIHSILLSWFFLLCSLRTW